MKSEYRLKILQKIKEYEKAELWDKDVEDDPETLPLTPDKVDYLCEKPFNKLFNKIANRLAIRYYEKLIKKGYFVIENVFGLENLQKVSQGVILTCNHFSVLDNYAVWRAIRDIMPKGKLLHKVIREGNYTNFKGLFGFFFRHCNTLPLSSNTETMKKFMKSVATLLNRGEKILIYPEQAMWWNYRKPRPLKNGAFRIASKNKAPIVPVFITMKDTEKLDADGFPVQAYTLWFLPAIYPKEELSDKENAEYMKNQNYQAWKEVYEKVYNIPLTYGD